MYTVFYNEQICKAKMKIKQKKNQTNMKIKHKQGARGLTITI